MNDTEQSISLCCNATTYPPSPLMMKHGNDDYFCSKCQNRCGFQSAQPIPTPVDGEMKESISSAMLEAYNAASDHRKIDFSYRDKVLQLIKQDRERTRIFAQFELCRDLINKNHDGVQINWNALGGDVANKKVELAQKLTPTNSEADCTISANLHKDELGLSPLDEVDHE